MRGTVSHLEYGISLRLWYRSIAGPRNGSDSLQEDHPAPHGEAGLDYFLIVLWAILRFLTVTSCFMLNMN